MLKRFGSIAVPRIIGEVDEKVWLLGNPIQDFPDKTGEEEFITNGGDKGGTLAGFEEGEGGPFGKIGNIVYQLAQDPIEGAKGESLTKRNQKVFMIDIFQLSLGIQKKSGIIEGFIITIWF